LKAEEPSANDEGLGGSGAGAMPKRGAGGHNPKTSHPMRPKYAVEERLTARFPLMLTLPKRMQRRTVLKINQPTTDAAKRERNETTSG
jgi:hypothetical protein